MCSVSSCLITRKSKLLGFTSQPVFSMLLRHPSTETRAQWRCPGLGWTRQVTSNSHKRCTSLRDVGCCANTRFPSRFLIKTSKKNYIEVWKSNSTPQLRSPRCLRGVAWSRKNTRLHAKNKIQPSIPKSTGRMGGLTIDPLTSKAAKWVKFGQMWSFRQASKLPIKTGQTWWLDPLRSKAAVPGSWALFHLPSPCRFE